MEALYKISENLNELYEMAQDPDVTPEVIRDTIEAVEGEYEEKAEGCVVVMKRLDAQAEMIQKEIDRLTRWRDSCQKGSKRIGETLMNSMIFLGKQKVVTEHYRLGVARNGGVAPMWVNPNIDEIPEEYIIRKPQVDTKKVRDALNNGEDLSFARLEERGKHLSIR